MLAKNVVGCVFVIILLNLLSNKNAVGQQSSLSQLSYPNIDDYVVRPRPTTTSTEATPTTTKKSLFSSFTGLFKKSDKSSTEQPTTTSTTSTTTTAKPTQSIPITQKPILGSTTVNPKVDVLTIPPNYPRPTAPTSTVKPANKEAFPPLPSKPQSPDSSVSLASLFTTKKPKDDFPPLPTKPGQQSGSTPTPGSPWTNLPPPSVTFVPKVPPQATSTPSTPSDKKEIASDAELKELSEQLFTKDTNSPNKFVTANYQGRTSTQARTDEAPNALLQLNENELSKFDIIEKMRLLYNNYEQDTLVHEYVTPIEKKEENELIDALLATSVMRQVMIFLQRKGIVTPDPKTHKDLLKQIWFTLYSRGQGKIGSSGFEHVFLHEIKNGTVIGLHNWLYFHDVEKSGHIDYKGYTKKLDLGNKGSIVKVRLSFDNIDKPSNSLFIGTSPELEMALYTLCFEVRQDKECPLSYSGKDFYIKTYAFRYHGKNMIGSAYPDF
uniref:Putative polyu-specific endoribonuclease n=1 Tax=Corethrella appendiculata TaxID=1370023 RepID=U5EP18_9DIPT